mgnify:FL=1
MITPIFWIIPVASILALVFAWFFFRQMMKESEGTELMAKIARHVRKGAMSYLKQQYKVVASVFLAWWFCSPSWRMDSEYKTNGFRSLS